MRLVLSLMALVIAAAALMFAADSPPKPEWQPLFDGKSLKGWKETDFAGHAEVEVKDGRILLNYGNDMTGITWAGQYPKLNYELSLEAMRVDGTDFFCGLTFPVGDDPCSLIVGGWGGGVVGLSSIDGHDASDNDTTQYMTFEAKRWYKIRLKVTKGNISAWIDDKQVVDQDLEGKKLSVRSEVELSRPLGISSWCTTAALREIKLRKVEVPK